MARTGGSVAVLGGLLALAVIQPVACDGDGKDGGTTALASTLDDVLAAVGPDVVLPTLARVHTAGDGLVAATAAWSADAASDDARLAAQEAWRATMDAWQEAEVHQLGPAGAPLATVGGEGLRDEVYSWPTVNRCRVDQETIAAEWDSPTFFDLELVDAYGLSALETLLFSPPGVNACPPQVDINADGTWDALGADAIRQRRADYAAALAVHVAAVVADLEGRWSGAFGPAFAAAAAPYESDQDALNAIFDALFYLELGTQDAKLASPLGLRDCTGDTCADQVETLLAGGSQDWVRANLRGFRALFTGGDGAGMDDLLRAAGHAETADAVIARLDDADAAAAALQVPINVAAAGNPTKALAVHAAIQAVTDLLEGDVATVLVLQIPSEAAGDND